MENQENTLSDDANLVKLCKEGSRNAFDQLVLKYQDRIYNMIARSVRDVDLAADLTQDTLINAYKGIGNFKENSTFFTWLFRIAINNVKNCKRKSNKVISISKLSNKDDAQELFEPVAENAEPTVSIENEERDLLIQNVIASLEEPFKTALILRDIEELSYEQMQEILDCPIGTVRSRIHRARSMVKEKLEKYL